MYASMVVHIIGILFFFSMGFMFTFFSRASREYYFRTHKEGVELTGFPKSFIDKYPGHIFFRVFGIVALAASILLAVALVKKLQG